MGSFSLIALLTGSVLLVGTLGYLFTKVFNAGYRDGQHAIQRKVITNDIQKDKTYKEDLKEGEAIVESLNQTTGSRERTKKVRKLYEK